MKKVITYGTFDLFHVGHIRLLKRLKNLGDELYVGLSTDEFNGLKGKKCVMPYEERKEILLSCMYVDHVFPEKCWEQKSIDVEKYNIAIFAMGDDWSGKFDFLQDSVEVVYLPRTEGVSTTDIKKIVSAANQDKIYALKHMLENALNHVNNIKF